MRKKNQNIFLLGFLLSVVFGLVSCATTLNNEASIEDLKPKTTQVVQGVVEENKPDSSIFKEVLEPITAKYEINGQFIDVVADVGKGTIYYPSVFTKDDVYDAFSTIGQKYMDYLGDVSFIVGKNKVDFTYPENWGAEEFAFAENILFEELPAYINGLLNQSSEFQPVQISSVKVEDAMSVVGEPVNKTPEKVEEVNPVAVEPQTVSAVEQVSETTKEEDKTEIVIKAEETEAKSNTLLILIIIFVVCVAITAIYYFMIYKNRKESK